MTASEWWCGKWFYWA